MNIYVSEKNKKYLVISSLYNDGTGAIVCKISNKKLYRTTPFGIENNDAGDYFDGTKQIKLSNQIYTEAYNTIKSSLDKYKLSDDVDPYKSNAIQITEDLLKTL
jgi:hypothetical protein